MNILPKSSHMKKKSPPPPSLGTQRGKGGWGILPYKATNLVVFAVSL